MNRGRCRFFTTCTGSPSFHKNTRSSVVQPSETFYLVITACCMKTLCLRIGLGLICLYLLVYVIEMYAIKYRSQENCSCRYSQLAIRREHVCLSSGYSFKFIGHDKVSDIRMLYNTLPFGKIRMYTLGMIMLWKWPSFSFEKNKSGIHTLLASVKVRYFRRPVKNSFVTYAVAQQ